MGSARLREDVRDPATAQQLLTAFNGWFLVIMRVVLGGLLFRAGKDCVRKGFYEWLYCQMGLCPMNLRA